MLKDSYAATVTTSNVSTYLQPLDPIKNCEGVCCQNQPLIDIVADIFEYCTYQKRSLQGCIEYSDPRGTCFADVPEIKLHLVVASWIMLGLGTE